MTRQYENDHNDDLYSVQGIVMPYRNDYGRRERNFSSPKWRKHYKVDKDFTPAERTKILARVSEVGATRAADEFGTRRWVIMQWLDNLEKFGSIDNPNQKSKNSNYKDKDKKHSFDREKQNQNFVNKEISADSNQQQQNFSQETNIDKILENGKSNFQNFEFNFDAVLNETETQKTEGTVKPAETKKISANTTTKLKTSEDFTQQQREEILKLSDKIGIKEAALQAQTKIDVIKYWRKNRKKNTVLQTKKQTPITNKRTIKKDAFSSLEAENEFLKAEVVKLETEIKKLTKELNGKI